MTDVFTDIDAGGSKPARGKFSDPELTADGQIRASVQLERLDTLWINTGTLCNIECANCYIESSPTNDRLAYISAAEARAYFDEIGALNLRTQEIAFTGGEPFMNPDMIPMAREALSRGFEVLILTNAMQPMQRKRVKNALLDLDTRYSGCLTLRVSLDHYSKRMHETERGRRTWDIVLQGLDWLAEHNFRISIAGRTCWGEPESEAREGYADLISSRGWPVDASDPLSLVLFPEMDETVDVPEISAACWDVVGVASKDVMCATSRMIVKRKGADRPSVLPCTLLPYDAAFEMGVTLAEAAHAQGPMFDAGAVKLCHPHCAKFCVLGGGKCAA